MIKFDKDIGDFVKKYKIIPNDLCDSVIQELQTCNFSEHQFYDSATNKSSSGEKELDVSWDDVSGYEPLMEVCQEALKMYVMEDMNYSWLGVTGISGIRFNRYNKNTQMRLHCDHIQSLFDGERKGIPILTILGSLNDNYSGGQFYIWDKPLTFEKGEIIIFPSVFLYPHKVDEVTGGTRYSFVSWAW
jgi:hypothetical protein